MAKIYLLLVGVFLASTISAQNIIKGKVIDFQTQEALIGVAITDKQNNGTVTTSNGSFELQANSDSIHISYLGYKSQAIKADSLILIKLSSTSRELNSVVVSASREEQKRSEAPIAISNISSQTIEDTKPTTIDQVLDKVSGVHMTNLGNEQHNMSIRQPLSYGSLFLYLEDGVPVRTSGLFNHNALLEINMAAVRNIEIIRGPASSLYGQEAVGGAVNFITLSPTAIPTGKIAIQGNDIGYKRSDLSLSNTFGKLAVAVEGYYANREKGVLEHSDFHKTGVSARIDYHFNEKTVLNNSVSFIKYYSEMGGGIDSAKFAKKDYTDFNTFKYSDVYALRAKSALSHYWNIDSKTSLTALYRDNSIKQNPSYVIASYLSSPHGQLNDAFFKSYALIAQHKQSFNWKKAVVIVGASTDYSPSGYIAEDIFFTKNLLMVITVQSYDKTNVTLSDYKVNVLNNAAYVQAEFSPIKKLRLVGASRYDNFIYTYTNHLPSTASSGAPDSKNSFNAFSPKVGLTYDFGKSGLYTNYSQGFVPPQITELYKAVKVPTLKPATFNNYELGGWVSLIKDKIYADLSVYRLEGIDEIVSVRNDDGSYQNKNAGKTRHQGIEYGITYRPIEQWMLRLSGSNAKHAYVNYIEKGKDFSGNEMPNAPHWIANAEAIYKPQFLKGSRIGAELQHLDAYYMDQDNTVKYSGYTIFNLRLGYEWKSIEAWLNIINAGNLHYATIASKSQYGYSYTLGEPRNINIGIAYKFSKSK